MKNSRFASVPSLVRLAAVFALGGCASNPTGKAGAETASYLPPPSFPGAMRQLTMADAGTTVTVPVGQPFSVALVGVPSAGFAWSSVRVPSFIDASGKSVSGPTLAAQAQPGYTGGNSWEVLGFDAKTPGKGTLVLEQRQPWMKDSRPAATFKVTIIAK